MLKIDELKVSYGGIEAVKGITFEVPERKIVTLIGANGAGKSTTLRTIAGLVKPAHGCIHLQGEDITSLSPDRIVSKGLTLVPEGRRVFPDLTVLENMRLYGGIYGLTRMQILRRAVEVLDRLDFRSETGTLVGSLPLGWKQKLAFSVAALHRPEVIFLDEPTGGVDPVTRRQFWELIYEAAAGGTTVFVTTHYMDEAEYCSRVSIMVDGQIRALGAPACLKRQFAAGSMDEVFRILARGAKRSE